MDNCSIIIITHDVNIVSEIVNDLSPLPVSIFNGAGFPSFSKLVNSAIVSAENDNIILINYKARPQKEHIFKILELLDKGYGYVGLYRFGFFGINKNLIKKIGFFDERYVGGEYEDCDFVRRHLENNIACYEAEEIEYHHKKSLWNNSIAKQFFNQKWTHDYPNGIIYKNLPEEQYDYDLRIKIPKDNFLDLSHNYNWRDDYAFFKNRVQLNY